MTPYGNALQHGSSGLSLHVPGEQVSIASEQVRLALDGVGLRRFGRCLLCLLDRETTMVVAADDFGSDDDGRSNNIGNESS